MTSTTAQRQTLPHRKIPAIRASVEVCLDGSKEAQHGRALLSDLSPTSICCFMASSLPKGAMISIVIHGEKHLFVRGQVIWCCLVLGEKRVIRTETFDYRTGIQFIFDTPEEALTVKNYCEALYV